VKIVFGTDAVAGSHGRNAEEFISRVNEAGEKPMDAIVSATSASADALGMGDRIGTSLRISGGPCRSERRPAQRYYDSAQRGVCDEGRNGDQESFPLDGDESRCDICSFSGGVGHPEYRVGKGPGSITWGLCVLSSSTTLSLTPARGGAARAALLLRPGKRQWRQRLCGLLRWPDHERLSAAHVTRAKMRSTEVM